MRKFRNTLDDWELILRREVGGGDLLLGQLPLGEPPYNDVDMVFLGRFLAPEFSRESFIRGLKKIERRWPLSFALYLVLMGIYNYQSGTYWPFVNEQLGLSGANKDADCGQAFRRILKKYHLPTFENLGGLTNLVPILAHGGIPNSSLGDFFRLLYTSAEESLIAVDAETLIEDWSVDPEMSFFFIDKPVERYLLHGGLVAEDFLTRCITLLEAVSDEEIAELALPQRIVDGHYEWQEEKVDRRLRKSRIRLIRPSLYLDPYGDGVCLELPPQKFPSTITFSKLDWILDHDNHNREIICFRERTADGYEFSVPEVILAPEVEEYHISLRCDGDPLRTWTLTGISTPPLLLFDPDTGGMLNEDLQKQPGERWILYPDNFNLTISDGRKTGELPQQYGEWGKYAIEEWELNPGCMLKLTAPGGEYHDLKISDSLALRRPRLVGGVEPLDIHLRSKFPLYSGPPPKLVISFSIYPDDGQLDRWRITVTPEGVARPKERRSFQLSELKKWITINNKNQALLDLSSIQMLGPDPCGKFEINAQGPYGRGRRLGLRIVPALQIEGHQQLYLSRKDGPAFLEMITANQNRLQCLEDSSVDFVPTSSNDHTIYRVEAAPSVQRISFAFFDSDNIRVPFTILVRRLRWALWQGSEPETFAWQSDPIRIHPQVLEDTFNTKLYVDLPTLVEKVKLFAGWRLTDGQDRIVTERRPDLSQARQQFSIPFAELMPSFREAQKSGDVLSLQIWICRQNAHTREDFIDALYLFPWLNLGDIHTEWEDLGEQVRIVVRWDSPQSFRHLHLFLWPADQPWIESPIDLPMEDSCSGYAEWYVPKSNLLAPLEYQGNYLGEVVIVDPWSGMQPGRPDPNNNAFLEFIPQTAETFYAALEAAVEYDTASPEEALMALSYQNRTRQYEKMYNTNLKLRTYALQGLLNLDQMILWADLVKDLEKPIAYKLAQWSIFSAKVLELLNVLTLEAKLVERYLKHLPDNLPESFAYFRFLNIGYSQVRRMCITFLCRNSETIGLVELLKDVQDSKILISEAAEILKPVYDFAADYLRHQVRADDSKDAFFVLRTLSDEAGKQPMWIEPGFLLETNNGVGHVYGIGEIKSKKSLTYCWPDSECILDFRLQSIPAVLKAVINLKKSKIKYDSPRLYQCSRCQKICGDSIHSVEEHFREQHGYESPAFRVAKPPVFELTQLVIHWPEEGTQDELASN